MSKKFYIKDENGMHFSEDRKTRYTLLEGKALHDFLKTEQGKKCCFHIQTDDNGDQVGIETTRENMRKCQDEWKKKSRQIEYEESNNIQIISANTPLPELDGCKLIDTFADDSESVEEILMQNEMLKTLHGALRKLTVEEYELVYHLFLKEEPLTEREYSKLTGIPQKTINNRKKALLKKLKTFFDF